MQAAPRPREKSETPDYGKLYSIVNVLFDSGGAANDEKNHKQMMEQLEPGQRCAHCLQYLLLFLSCSQQRPVAWDSSAVSNCLGR